VKIIYLHQYFNTPLMSGGTRSYEMARRLVAAGHEVHMATSDRQRSGKPYKTVEDGIQVTWIPVAYSNHMGALARIRAFVDFAWKSARIASKVNGDVVFATSTPLTIAIPGIVASRRRRIPMVFEVRDPWPDMLVGLGAIRNPLLIRLTKWFERFAYHRSKRIVALSDGINAVILSTGYPADRIAVIPNSSDIEAFDVPAEAGSVFRQKYDWLQGRRLVLYAGTIGIANGVDYLVRVAKEMLLLDDQVRFLVIGDGGQQENVRSLARELGVLGVNFHMLPPMTKAEVPSVFSAADISLVLLKDVPELWANSSNKFFDGLAAGRPVVVNNVGWQSKLLNETGAGFDLDPRDHRSAAVKLLSHLNDNDSLKAAGIAARSLAEDRFDRNKLAIQLERVLHDAVTA
jgi:glycosyltransferase involved in cell wall biosynthesis